MASRNRLHDLDDISGADITDGVMSVAHTSLESDAFDHSTIDSCSQRKSSFSVCSGLRQFLCRALKEVNFSGESFKIS
jgi:hypothetical protein